MNSARLILWLFALLGCSCFGEPEFIGVLNTKSVTYVALRLDAVGKMMWVGIGDSAGGYQMSKYDPQKETLLLKRADDTTFELRLKTASVKPAPCIEMFEGLSKNGDREMKRLYLEALSLDAQRKRTAAEIAKLEALGHKDADGNEPMGYLRKQLRLDESNLARQLSILMDAVQSAESEGHKTNSPNLK